ncbi:hypothetical protein DSUL_20197 [Desulfovibrionales bacterium]
MYYLDGRITAVLSTHIHVQADGEYFFHDGTETITDVSICSVACPIFGIVPYQSSTASLLAG